MEDYIDERFPMCRYYLTDIDGLWECQEGCNTYSELDGKVTVTGNPFQWHEEMNRERELYNSEGNLIGGELFDMAEMDLQIAAEKNAQA